MKVDGVDEFRIEELAVSIHPSNAALGAAAAAEAAAIIRSAVAARGVANVVLATGNSQKTFLAALRERPDVAWDKVNVFHLDEYVGIDPKHPASFPNFLRQNIVDQVRPGAFHPLQGTAASAPETCRRYEALLRAHPADLCALGIGENGHLAFNDPPYADFNDPVWVKVITLADASRRQQVNEGHFASLAEVPVQAITLTIPAILSAKQLLVMVPEGRKAEAVVRTLYGPISEDCPSSLLRQTPRAHLFLDRDSAARLSRPG